MPLSDARDDLAAILHDQSIDETHPAIRQHLTMLEVSGFEVLTESDWNRVSGHLVLDVCATIQDRLGEPVATLRRLYDPVNRIAHHRAIDVHGAPGEGIGPTLMLQALRHLAALDYEQIVFSAEPPIGRAYWARYDVSFVGGADGVHADRVRRWFDDTLPLFGIDPVPGALPKDFWQVGWDYERGCVGSAVRISEVGRKLGIDPGGILERRVSDTSHLGEALLLFGPDWKGTIRLRSNEARSMRIQLAAAIQRAAERSAIT